MRTCSFPLSSVKACLGKAGRRFRGDCRGVTAIEFGLVALPFAAMMMGIMTIGLQYFTVYSLENGVADAARKLRTGEAQKAGLTVGDFRKLLCDAAGSYLDCDEHLVVHVTSGATFASLSPPTNCVTDGKLTPSQGQPADKVQTRSGQANAAVLVIACYEWEMGASLWQSVWNLITPLPQTDGKTIVSATTAFRSEPYE
jgi:Flp pilus assembly protein TadG